MPQNPATFNNPWQMTRSLAAQKPAIELECVNESQETFEIVLFDAFRNLNDDTDFINPFYGEELYVPDKSNFYIRGYPKKYREVMYETELHPFFVGRLEYEVINYDHVDELFAVITGFRRNEFAQIGILGDGDMMHPQDYYDSKPAERTGKDNLLILQKDFLLDGYTGIQLKFYPRSITRLRLFAQDAIH